MLCPLCNSDIYVSHIEGINAYGNYSKCNRCHLHFNFTDASITFSWRTPGKKYDVDYDYKGLGAEGIYIYCSKEYIDVAFLGKLDFIDFIKKYNTDDKIEALLALT